jgi:hypothetical protein
MAVLTHRRLVGLGLIGAGGLVLLGLLTLAAVLLSTFFVVEIANQGPVPGEKHDQTTQMYDLSGLAGPNQPKAP